MYTGGTKIMTNKTEVFSLTEIANGDIMYWNVTSQCYNKFKIVLKAGDKVYFTASKNDNSTDFKKIEEGYAFYDGEKGNLILEVTFDNGGLDVRQSSHCDAITDARSKTVGFAYTYCFEDGVDEDYNDAYLAVMAWRKAY